MNDQFGGALAVVVGVTLARLGLTDAHQLYVKAAMGKWLVVAGLVLTALGAWRMLRRQPHAEHADDHHEHEHHGHREPTVALLLMLPVFAVFLVAPPSLGIFAADRAPAPQVTRDPASTIPASAFAPLPAEVDGAVPLTVAAYVEREVYGGGPTLDGRRIRLVGIAGPVKGTTDVRLVRFSIACCAADGQANEVLVRGLPSPLPERDQWIEVVGTHVAGFVDGRPVLAADEWIAIKQPADPYE